MTRTINFTEINTEPYLIPLGVIKLIGVSGKAESGKGTLGRIAGYKGYDEVGFATTLKKAAREIFMLSEHEVNNTRGKASFNPYWDSTNRSILQRFGTNAMQPIFGSDIWVKSLHIRLHEKLHRNNTTKFIITDVRFQWEVEYIEAMGGKIVYCDRDNSNGLEVSEKLHKSEDFDFKKVSSWMENKYNLYYNRNHGSIVDYIKQCFDLMKDFKSQGF